MTEIQRSILDIVQKDFPLELRPFLTIGKKAGITEERCIEILKNLSQSSILRSIRAIISWNKIGFSTVLIGMSVDPEKIESVAQMLNSIERITHNYERQGALNLWFTLIYESSKEKDNLLNYLKKIDGVQQIREFHAEKTYKIGLVLDV